MSLSQEAGKVATSAIEALKVNPSCLAAILLAGIFSVLTYFALQKQADRETQERMEMIRRCWPMSSTYSDDKDHPR